MAKLTLNVEPDIVHAAKAYAQAHHISLSKLVSQFLRALPQPAPADFWTQLHSSLLDEGFQVGPGYASRRHELSSVVVFTMCQGLRR